MIRTCLGTPKIKFRIFSSKFPKVDGTYKEIEMYTHAHKEEIPHPPFGLWGGIFELEKSLWERRRSRCCGCFIGQYNLISPLKSTSNQYQYGGSIYNYKQLFIGYKCLIYVFPLCKNAAFLI